MTSLLVSLFQDLPVFGRKIRRRLLVVQTLVDQQRALLLMAILRHPLIVQYAKKKATKNLRQLSSKLMDLSP